MLQYNINIKTAIFKENHPENMLTKDDQDQILDDLGREFHGTQKGELPRLRYFRLEGGALIYVCTEQQPG
jgi:hypothetical protein